MSKFFSRGTDAEKFEYRLFYINCEAWKSTQIKFFFAFLVSGVVKIMICCFFPPRIHTQTSISAQSQCLVDEILVDIMVHIVGNGVITVQNVAELALH